MVAITKPVNLRRAAQADLVAAGDWYERARPGLAVRFTAAVQQAFDLIGDRPQLYAVLDRDVRSAAVPGFPYRVYYRERPSAVVVLAVLHTSRDPSVWQSRS
ncbi:MAG: Plasmid stabilization system protein [Phycisphaerales bacterium]|nr:Plasmid stabilization system protein [Phycisphaerales bacterium]